jgi:TP901 family phage tail tape measure protein
VAGRADTARLLAELSLVDKFSPGVNSALKSVGRLEKGVGRVGKGFGQMSSGVTRAGTIIAGAAVTGLGAAAKAAIEWEDAFTGVVKTVDEADLAKAGLTFDDISNSLRKMSTEMPNTAIELAGIAEAAGAMGIAGKDIEAFTRQVAIMASTTNVSAEEGAVALGQMQNVIGLTGDEFDNFVASLVALGNAGNSTEAQILEIARRAGGAAKLFGIAKEETLGWAAAAANLGLNEELAGTALQKMFVELLPDYIKGSKTLQEVTGQTGKQLKQAYEKDAGGAIQSLIKDLSKLGKADRLEAIQALFGKGSGITRLVNGLADSYAQNLEPSLDGATQSWEEATAAQIEFEKRNATVRSAIARLSNGVKDAAVTLGEGFAPAVGRAATKLASFLGDDANRSAIKSLGEDIGKAIDDIDWDEALDAAKSFVGILKDALGWAKRIFDVFNALPAPVKGAAAGFLALDKLSGGLIGAGAGNIIGGLGETIARSAGGKLPGVGKLFAQPVFVTNWPMGGLGGAGGAGVAGAAGKGLSALSKVFLVGEAIGLAATVLQVRNEISDGNTAHAQAISNQTAAFIDSNPNPAALQTALDGVNQGISDLTSNPLLTIVQGDALVELRKMRSSLMAERTRKEGLSGNDKEDRNNPVPPAIAEMRTEFVSQVKAVQKQTADVALQVQRKGEQTVTSVGQAKTAVDASKNRLAAAADRGTTVISSTTRDVASATRQVAPPIVSAIRNLPVPIVNVNVTAATVTKSVTYQNRSGPGNGSSGGGSHPGSIPV